MKLMGVNIVDTIEIFTEVEQVTILSKGKKTYRHVAYYTEKCSGYDWYDEKGKIEDPDWADNLDMEEIWQSHQNFLKTSKKGNSDE